MRPDLSDAHLKTVDDLLGDQVRLLLVGINPGLWTAAVNAHFAHPGNRFWPAMQASGLLDRRLDVSQGWQPGDRELLLERGIGITNLCPRPTAKADELTRDELLAGAERLRAVVRELRPAVVAVIGITAHRVAFGRPKAVLGHQPESLEGADLWVLPQPSGLNAHATPAKLAVAFGEVAHAAGLVEAPPHPGDGQ